MRTEFLIRRAYGLIIGGRNSVEHQSRMAGRAKTGSFVTVVELLPTGKQAKKLRAKFEAARQVYNAALGEALHRRYFRPGLGRTSTRLCDI